MLLCQNTQVLIHNLLMNCKHKWLPLYLKCISRYQCHRKLIQYFNEQKGVRLAQFSFQDSITSKKQKVTHINLFTEIRIHSILALERNNKLFPQIHQNFHGNQSGHPDVLDRVYTGRIGLGLRYFSTHPKLLKLRNP